MPIALDEAIFASVPAFAAPLPVLMLGTSLTDGQISAVIREGRGRMPAFNFPSEGMAALLALNVLVAPGLTWWGLKLARETHLGTSGEQNE